MAKKVNPNNLEFKNKKASFEFAYIETFTAGIVLRGTEIKSIRNSEITLNEAYCLILKDELWVRGMHIAQYKDGSYNNHIEKSDRKLLLNRREILKIKNHLKDKGLTIVATKLFLTDKGYAKLNIAVAKGKKLYDKREDLKQKDNQREIDRVFRK